MNADCKTFFRNSNKEKKIICISNKIKSSKRPNRWFLQRSFSKTPLSLSFALTLRIFTSRPSTTKYYIFKPTNASIDSRNRCYVGTQLMDNSRKHSCTMSLFNSIPSRPRLIPSLPSVALRACSSIIIIVAIHGRS